MRIAKDDIPVRIDVPGATARQQSDFGGLFYWPPGHSVRAEDDTDIVMFSPQAEHCAVIEHIRKKVGQ